MRSIVVLVHNEWVAFAVPYLNVLRELVKLTPGKAMMGSSRNTPTAGGQLWIHGRLVAAGKLDDFGKGIALCEGTYFGRLGATKYSMCLVFVFVFAGALRTLYFTVERQLRDHLFCMRDLADPIG